MEVQMFPEEIIWFLTCKETLNKQHFYKLNKWFIVQKKNDSK